EQSIPGGTDRLELVDRDQRAVSRTAPAGDVAFERYIRLRPPAGVVGVAEHVAHERQILCAGRPDHVISSVSWMRFPSGSKTSTSRTCPWSSRMTPTSTPSLRSRSTSARRSGTLTEATP